MARVKLALIMQTGTRRKIWRLFCDGAARGNPGPAAIGAVLFAEQNETPLFEISQMIGSATNNVAEYRALICGLEATLKFLAKEKRNDSSYMEPLVEIFLDSELVVKQIQGAYKVKNPGLKQLHEKANQLLKNPLQWSISHISRTKNSKADALANRALDENNK